LWCCNSTAHQAAGELYHNLTPNDYYGLLLLQVAAELDKGTLAEPPPGWIRPGEVADTAEESGSSGEPQA
jgi:hypothetical protein